LTNFQSQLVGQRNPDRYASEYMDFIHNQFKLSHMLWAEENLLPRVNQEKLIYAFRTLIIYFFLGSTRGQNRIYHQSLSEKIQKNLVNKKAIGSTLLRIAKCQTKEFQTIMTQMYNMESGMLTKHTEYLYSIAVFHNFLIHSRAPVVMFTQYHCLNCEKKQSVKIDIAYNEHAQEVKAYSDVNGTCWLSLRPLIEQKIEYKSKHSDEKDKNKPQIQRERKYLETGDDNKPHFQVEKQQREEYVRFQNLRQLFGSLCILPSSLISEILGYTSDTYSIAICGISQQPKLTSAESFPIPCNDGDCLTLWSQRVQTVGLETLLLSYGFFHEKTLPVIDSFHPISGTSQDDSSLFLVKHIFCCQSTNSEPLWRRA